MDFLRLSVYFASLLVGVWGQTNASWLNVVPPFGSEPHPLEPTARWGRFVPTLIPHPQLFRSSSNELLLH